MESSRRLGESGPLPSSLLRLEPSGVVAIDRAGDMHDMTWHWRVVSVRSGKSSRDRAKCVVRRASGSIHLAGQRVQK